MAINSINNYTSTSNTTSTAKTTAKDNTKDTASKTATTTESTGVVYEKSTDADSVKVDRKAQNAALIAKMKADTDNRLAQLQDIVSQMMTKQGVAIGTADDVWKFLAEGNYTVSEAAKAQAQKDIAEDGYWGVKQTSDRIVDFAKALSGGDTSKADELIAAVKKGFKEATGAWGKELPEISQKTYDAALEKLEAWKNGEEDTTTAETEA